MSDGSKCHHLKEVLSFFKGMITRSVMALQEGGL